MPVTPSVILTRAGQHGEDEENAIELGLAIIGFRDVPSLADSKTRDEIKELLRAENPDDSESRIGNFSGQLHTFANRMTEGDIVVLPKKQSSQIALGRVTGPYAYQNINGHMRHTRPVQWINTDIPRTAFEQDLLYSFGAFMTVCRVKRNHAALRIEAVLETGRDPGGSAGVPVAGIDQVTQDELMDQDAESTSIDLGQIAHDQIVAHIQSKFSGHKLSDLVNAVLVADGWSTKVSPPGPDEGVDILAGRGPLGLDDPRLCVQVKSQPTAADVNVYRSLQGSMQTYNANQGLLVCWGGYTGPVLKEARQGHFAVRLWESSNLVEAIYRTYDKLPAEIQADLPLKQTWVLVLDTDDA
tara:strand:+ start:754 stop:1821 length:1068 start_codon:yes stop_codon:yes gene_type:complete